MLCFIDDCRSLIMLDPPIFRGVSHRETSLVQSLVTDVLSHGCGGEEAEWVGEHLAPT